MGFFQFLDSKCSRLIFINVYNEQYTFRTKKAMSSLHEWSLCTRIFLMNLKKYLKGKKDKKRKLLTIYSQICFWLDQTWDIHLWSEPEFKIGLKQFVKKHNFSSFYKPGSCYSWHYGPKLSGHTAPTCPYNYKLFAYFWIV